MSVKPAAVSVGIIPAPARGHVLFIERADGGIALPGGYVDERENAAAAITRESYEEMGLRLDAQKWRLFDSAATECNKLILFSHYTDEVPAPAVFQANDEVLRVISAPWNTPLVFALHEQALRRWAGMHGLPALALRPPRAVRVRADAANNPLSLSA